jgi:hypothetical protein
MWLARKGIWASGAVVDVATGAAQRPHVLQPGWRAARGCGRSTIPPIRQQRPDDLARVADGWPRLPAMTLQGRVLGGRYALGARVGAGAWRQVYRARDRVLERTVAVKVLYR